MSQAALSRTECEEKTFPKVANFEPVSLRSTSLKPICNFNAGSDFTAVILRTVIEKNKTLFQLVLAHPMPEHSVIVASHDDDLDIIADWRFIGAKLNLPLFSLSISGHLEKFTEYGVGNSHLRRFGSPLSKRRTRFSNRRKMGIYDKG